MYYYDQNGNEKVVSENFAQRPQPQRRVVENFDTNVKTWPWWKIALLCVFILVIIALLVKMFMGSKKSSHKFGFRFY